MKTINYQILLKAETLKESVKKKEKSVIIFATKTGKELLFKIFKLLTPELYRPLKINENVNSVDILFTYFADHDLSTDESLNNAINTYLEELRNKDPWLDKLNSLFISLRKERIQFWEEVIDQYLENEEENKKELQKLWIDRKVNLGLKIRK